MKSEINKKIVELALSHHADDAEKFLAAVSKLKQAAELIKQVESIESEIKRREP